YSTAEPCRWMDVDSKRLRDAILEVRGQSVPLLLPQPVSDSVRLQSVKALVIKKRLRISPRRRVSGPRGQQIGADRGADRRIAGIGVIDQVAQQDRRQLWRVQLVGQNHTEAVFQLLMPKHRGE